MSYCEVELTSEQIQEHIKRGKVKKLKFFKEILNELGGGFPNQVNKIDKAIQDIENDNNVDYDNLMQENTRYVEYYIERLSLKLSMLNAI